MPTRAEFQRVDFSGKCAEKLLELVRIIIDKIPIAKVGKYLGFSVIAALVSFFFGAKVN